jgi:hypothetical protein
MYVSNYQTIAYGITAEGDFGWNRYISNGKKWAFTFALCKLQRKTIGGKFIFPRISAEGPEVSEETSATTVGGGLAPHKKVAVTINCDTQCLLM